MFPGVSILLVRCRLPLTLSGLDSYFWVGAFPVLSGRGGQILGVGVFFEAILPSWRESIVLGIPMRYYGLYANAHFH
jgi:hypothetical protein